MRRRGFTILETLLALSILALAMVMVAEIGYWSLVERRRADARHEAIELAANVMESARALPYDDLTPQWAAGQRLPDSSAAWLDEGRLTVRVEPEQGRPHLKRVTVEVGWKQGDGQPARPVQLVGLFGDRAAPAGGKP